jgi:hypothetical protein
LVCGAIPTSDARAFAKLGVLCVSQGAIMDVFCGIRGPRDEGGPGTEPGDISKSPLNICQYC